MTRQEAIAEVERRRAAEIPLPAGSRAYVTGIGSLCVSAWRQPRWSGRQPSHRQSRLATLRIPRLSEPRGSLAE
jgi:hypothetical protein